MKHFESVKNPLSIRCPSCGFTMRLREFDYINGIKKYKSNTEVFYTCTKCILALRNPPLRKTKKKLIEDYK